MIVFYRILKSVQNLNLSDHRTNIFALSVSKEMEICVQVKGTFDLILYCGALVIFFDNNKLGYLSRVASNCCDTKANPPTDPMRSIQHERRNYDMNCNQFVFFFPFFSLKCQRQFNAYLLLVILSAPASTYAFLRPYFQVFARMVSIYYSCFFFCFRKQEELIAVACIMPDAQRPLHSSDTQTVDGEVEEMVHILYAQTNKEDDAPQAEIDATAVGPEASVLE